MNDTAEPSAPEQNKPAWKKLATRKIWVLPVWAYVLIAFIVIGALSGGGDTTDEQTEPEPAATVAPTAAPEPEPAATVAPTAAPEPEPAATVAPTTAPEPEPAATVAPTTAPEPEPTSVYGPVVFAALPFGEAHTRDPGFGGEGWTVSIDDVVPIETFFSDGDCLAIVGTATLDSLDEGLTSTGFSFPEASLFQAGVKNSGLGFCDGTGLESQGMVLYLNAEVTVGTTFTWFKPFEVVQTDFDFAAIEDTVYTASGGDTEVGSRSEPSADGGSDDGPYPFGEAHTRGPGFGGEGWTVSIDDVVPIETFSSDGDCLAIVGTATLDSLDEGLTSTGFSFPEASLFQAGVKNSGLGFCDGTGLESQGMVLYLNAEVTVGTTFTWFKPFEVVQTDFDFAAIEDTVYEP